MDKLGLITQLGYLTQSYNPLWSLQIVHSISNLHFINLLIHNSKMVWDLARGLITSTGTRGRSSSGIPTLYPLRRSPMTRRQPRWGRAGLVGFILLLFAQAGCSPGGSPLGSSPPSNTDVTPPPLSEWVQEDFDRSSDGFGVSLLPTRLSQRAAGHS